MTFHLMEPQTKRFTMTPCTSKLLCGALLSLCLVACGGGDDATTGTVGGTVTGLAPGSSVTLDSAGVQVALPGNGPYAFAGLLTAGTPYTVNVTTQPVGQTCTVVNSTGVAADGIEAMVTVSCT